MFIVNTRNISLLISVLLKQWQCFCLWVSDTLRNLFTELECTIVFSLATSAKFENLLFIRSDCNRSPDGSAARILSMWVSQNYQNRCQNKFMGSRCWINHWGMNAVSDCQMIKELSSDVTLKNWDGLQVLNRSSELPVLESQFF